MTKRYVIMLVSTMGSINMHERIECKNLGHAIRYSRTLLEQHADKLLFPGEEMFYAIYRDKAGNKAGEETDADRIWVEHLKK